MMMMDAGGNWADYFEESKLVKGYICEWTFIETGSNKSKAPGH